MNKNNFIPELRFDHGLLVFKLRKYQQSIDWFQ